MVLKDTSVQALTHHVFAVDSAEKAQHRQVSVHGVWRASLVVLEAYIEPKRAILKFSAQCLCHQLVLAQVGNHGSQVLAFQHST